MPAERTPTTSISTRRMSRRAVARVDIVDNGGTTDHIDLDVDSTGFDDLPASAGGAAEQSEPDVQHGRRATAPDRSCGGRPPSRPQPSTGPSTLLHQDRASRLPRPRAAISNCAPGGDFTPAGGRAHPDDRRRRHPRRLSTTSIRPGATITCSARSTRITSRCTAATDNDTVIVGKVTSDTDDRHAGDGNDTINVGTPAPGTVDGISGSLTSMAKAEPTPSTWTTPATATPTPAR